MSADVTNYDLQNVELQRLLLVMQEDRINALALLYLNKDFKLDYSHVIDHFAQGNRRLNLK